MFSGTKNHWNAVVVQVKYVAVRGKWHPKTVMVQPGKGSEKRHRSFVQSENRTFDYCEEKQATDVRCYVSAMYVNIYKRSDCTETIVHNKIGFVFRSATE